MTTLDLLNFEIDKYDQYAYIEYIFICKEYCDIVYFLIRSIDSFQINNYGIYESRLKILSEKSILNTKPFLENKL